MSTDDKPKSVSPLTDDELARLPVFPLPGSVFFPNTTLPLHLFEPRYRAMAESCLSEGPKAMAITLLKPGWQSNYEGHPPVHEIAGAGRIVSHEALPNGTFNIVLEGTERVELEELATDTPYRVAAAKRLNDDMDGKALNAEVTTLLSCVSSVISAVRKEYPDFALGVDANMPPGQVADLVADRLVPDAQQRQRILEALNVRQRVDLVTDAVGELLAML